MSVDIVPDHRLSVDKFAMPKRFGSLPLSRMTALASLPVLLCATGCGAPVFPKELFTLDASEADYPVMVSKAPAKDRGRTIEAESGTHLAHSSSTYGYGNTRVTVTTTEHGQSEMPASQKFVTKVRRSDNWVQIDAAVFVAEDFAGYGYSSADRALGLQGKAHQ